jgi:hypothetical protein
MGAFQSVDMRLMSLLGDSFVSRSDPLLSRCRLARHFAAGVLVAV